jgi:hypothetical protein
MKPSKNPERIADALADLFPWPDDVPLPVPHFGKAGPSAPASLPSPGALCGPEREPFALNWNDPDLGLRVHVRERTGPEGAEIWAEAVATRPDLRGRSVSVALLGEGSDQCERATVRLDPDEDGPRGEVCFGRADDLFKELGAAVKLDAFLIVTPGG